MGNKVEAKIKSFLQEAGRDFVRALPWLETFGEAAVSVFIPGMSAIFNQTVNAVVTAEQNFAALGKQSGTGAQKLASVVSIMGGLIAQALADAGKESDDAAVQQYINGVVSILNTTPAPAVSVKQPS